MKTNSDRERAIELAKTLPSAAAVAKELGRAERTVRTWITESKNEKLTPEHQLHASRFRIRELEAMLLEAQRDKLDEAYIRSRIIGLKEQPPTPPEWMVKPKLKAGVPGVPTLLASDWHWGEVVFPEQINGVNAYNIEIAHARARRLIETTIKLLTTYTVNPKYPGFVLNLGGDMVSGDIHDELTQTNEMPIMPVVVDLFGVLIWAIRTLRDQFGHVAVFCVTGNHGRNTRKKQAKNRHYTSFDWLLYAFLQKHFEGDPKVKIVVASGPDIHYNVFDYRYVLTHGDQFYGGDGIIGALGPIMRGDTKKRARNGGIGLNFDTMLLGHWHQYMPLDRVVVNGSLIGYNEYANQGNFGFEPPRQALWITNPERGMIHRNPVYVDPPKEKGKSPDKWVSWTGEKELIISQ